MLKVKRADYIALCKAWENLHNSVDDLKAAILTADPKSDAGNFRHAWECFTDEYPKRYDDAISHCALLTGTAAASDFPADADFVAHHYSEVFKIVD